MRKVNWGIIGAGNIARQFANDIQYTSNSHLAAVAARAESGARKFARQYGVDKYYGSYAELYQDPSIDAIYIATPHTFHYQQTCDSIDAGKAVLCEKPLTINQQQCNKLIDLSAQHSGYLMEGMWSYFLPAIIQARQWADTGRIGTIRELRADFGFSALPFDASSRIYDKALAGGCLLDIGIYPIAVAWYFLQQDPVDMSVIAQYAPTGVEDDLAMVFNYPDCVATLGASFRRQLKNSCHIIGDKGHIVIPDFWCARQCSLYHGDTLVDQFDDDRQGGGFEFEIEAAAADILAGEKQSSIMPLSTSLKFQQHMDKVRSYCQEIIAGLSPP